MADLLRTYQRKSLIDMLDEAEAIVTARLAAIAMKGDLPGHEFRGNQWTGGIEGDYTNLKSMPADIDGVPITIKSLEDKRSLAVSTPYGIVVNKGAKQWKDIKAYQKMAYEAGWVSTDDPNGVLYHELGHYKHRESAGKMFEHAQNTNSTSSPRFKAIAPRVSKYAATNGKEFIAEVYAGVKSGKSYDEEVMSLYNEMNGPKP